MVQDVNPFHDGKRELTGDKKLYLGDNFKLETIKEASKKLGVTINDLMMTALSVGINRYFAS
jgi:NRPS condensation-like uncharacterized protein